METKKPLRRTEDGLPVRPNEKLYYKLYWLLQDTNKPAVVVTNPKNVMMPHIYVTFARHDPEE